MRENARRTPALACLALLLAIGAAEARERSAHPLPSLRIAPAEIALDIPLPVSGDLELLLAQAGQGLSLSALKEEALQRYRAHLQRELALQLHRFFEREQVPLVDYNPALALHQTLEITVTKHLNRMQSRRGFDLERGSVELRGEFRYQLRSVSGGALREEQIDITQLRLREPYEVKTPKDGGPVEDDTPEAIERTLSQLAVLLLERMEQNLRADQLSLLARG